MNFMFPFNPLLTRNKNRNIRFFIRINFTRNLDRNVKDMTVRILYDYTES